MCKKIGYEYYCKELFVIKKKLDTAVPALFTLT